MPIRSPPRAARRGLGRAASDLDPAPDGQRTLSLESDGVDLLPYVNEGARITASAAGSAPPYDVSYNGRLELLVVVL